MNRVVPEYMICPVCGWVGDETESLWLPFDDDNYDCCPVCSDIEEPRTWVILLSSNPEDV